MAKMKRTSRSNTRRASTKNGTAKDAIALLKADHRQVETWFKEFEKARDRKRKVTLATQICNALRVHTQIEEEIFYPAFREATDHEEVNHETIVEHNGGKKLIAEIEAMPSDDYFEARVMVLSEMIRYHVNEEEKTDGVFAKARRSEMDLDEIGEQLQARKSDLEADGSVLGKAKEFFEAA